MSLTIEEKQFIDNNERLLTNVIKHLETVRQFKIGDYLVAFYPKSPYHEKKMSVVNSYGTPKKFQVVAVDTHGVPYMKELNKRGKAVGNIIGAIRYKRNNDGMETHLTYDFEIDPEYTDAIILDNVDNFDASQSHKYKADTHKEITEFNKTLKVKISNRNDLVTYLLSLKVGDIMWKSHLTSWTIIYKSPLPVSPGNRPTPLNESVKFMKVQTNKGKVLTLCFNDMRFKAFYKDRPRTYKELKDPK